MIAKPVSHKADLELRFSVDQAPDVWLISRNNTVKMKQEVFVPVETG